MLQIWNALKILLVAYSAQRQQERINEQGRGYCQRPPLVRENVVVFMRRGLGTIQQYFTGRDDHLRCLWDGSAVDRFFEDACVEWQDEQILQNEF